MTLPCLPHAFRFLLLVNMAWLWPGASASAQFVLPPEPLPVISRMCLWNADKDTWHALGLKRQQVSRMDQLRKLYPAVVNGQWGVEPDDSDVLPTLDAPSMTMGPTAGLSNTQVAGAPVLPVLKAIPPNSLQADLLEVLTPQQIRAWDRLCSTRSFVREW